MPALRRGQPRRNRSHAMGASQRALDDHVTKWHVAKRACAHDAREDLAALAAEHSSCPSGRNGGALGTFSPGQMVPEFDKVVFSEEVGKVHGPVKTQFGYHLVEVTSRS